MKTKAESTDIPDDWVVSKIDHSSEDPNFGFVETLYQACSAALVSLWKSHFRLTTHNPQRSTLKKDIASIRFWEENFPAGHLDTILAESSGLKIRVLENLTGIGKILIPFLTDSDEAICSTQNKRNPECNFANDLEIQVEKAALMLDAEERSEPSSDDESSDDSSPVTERHQNRLGRLHSYISCLIDLTPVVERYICSLQCKAEVQSVPIETVFRLSHRALPYAMRIRDRFANAPTSLVERLAEANLERSIRLRTQEDEEEVGNHTNQDAVTLFKPFSQFHDSGLGTSIPTMSQYAATVASHTSFLSVAGEDALGRPRVPPLPLEGGRTFQCNYCHKTISMRNRIEWKIHVFADLEPYICTHEDCRDTLKTFPTRQLWADHELNEHFTLLRWRCFTCSIALSTPELFVEHLAQVHGIILTDHCLTAAISEARETVLTPEFEHYKCLLCLQDGWQTKKTYSTHVGRHLEEISLACLPRDIDSSDDGFDTDISSNPGDVDGPTSSTGEGYEVDTDSNAQTPAPQGNRSLATALKMELGVDGMAEATLPQEKEVVEKDASPPVSRPRDGRGRAKEGMYVFESSEAEQAMETPKASETGYRSLQPTSYWSVPEVRDFPLLLAHFGRDFEGISNFMKTKTTIMVENYYQRRVNSGWKDFEETVLMAEEKKSRGEPTGPLPGPSVAPKRRYEATPSAIVPRPLAPHGELMSQMEDGRFLSKGKPIAMPPEPMPLHCRLTPENERTASHYAPLAQASTGATAPSVAATLGEDGSRATRTQAPPSRTPGPRLGYFTEDRRDSASLPATRYSPRPGLLIARPSATPAPESTNRQVPAKRSNIMSILNDEPEEPQPRKASASEVPPGPSHGQASVSASRPVYEPDDQARHEDTGMPRSGQKPSSYSQPSASTNPFVVRQDCNGVPWIWFEHSRDRVKMEYTIRCDVESVNVENLTQEFKTENCIYPRACSDQYRGNRLEYETECNAVGWALAELNPSLRGKRGLIQRAVDSWRNSIQDPRVRSRRVRRMAKMNRRQAVQPALPNHLETPGPHALTRAGAGLATASAPVLSQHLRRFLDGPTTIPISIGFSAELPLDQKNPTLQWPTRASKEKS